jgi:hypothetical protein
MKENITEDKWLMSSFTFRKKPEKIDKEVGMMSGVYICTEGEALGHDVNLDSEFIANVVKMGNEKKQGLKVRFGHPNMSSTALGTFLGRAKNFTQGQMPDGSAVAIADVFLSNSAKEAPQGNLYDYVLSLANDDAKAFGMSIVFTNGGIYRKDKEGKKQYPYDSKGQRNKKFDEAEGINYCDIRELHASDMVDDPAANPNGIFSAFNEATIAGQVSEFLDLHPQIFEFVSKNPGVIERFTKRYEDYKKFQNKENKLMPEDKKPVSPESAPAVQAESKPEPKNKKELAAPVVPAAQEPAPAKPATETPKTAEPVPAAVPALEAKKEDLKKEDPKAEYKQMFDAFGAEIASEVFIAGGKFEDAQKKHLSKLEKENKELKEKVKTFEAAQPSGTEPVKSGGEPKEKAKLFKTVS